MSTFTSGQILILSDDDSEAAATISSVNGLTLTTGIATIRTLNGVGSLGGASGFVRATIGDFADAFVLYSQTFTAIATINPFGGNWHATDPVGVDAAGNYYVGGNPQGMGDTKIARVSPTGTVGTIWTIADVPDLSFLCVNAAGTIAYYAAGGANVPILHWDLVNDLSLGTLVAASTTLAYGSDSFITNAGDLMVLVQPDTGVQTGEARRYAVTDGALLQTYPIGVDALGWRDDVRMSHDVAVAFIGGTTQDAFWVMSFPDDLFHSLMRRFGVTSASLDHNFSLDVGTDVPFSCPIVGWSNDIGPGSIPPILPDEIETIPIRLVRRSPHVFSENKRVFISRVEPILRMGLGAVTGQGVNPTVMFRVSKDNGNTWGDYREASAGALGRYMERIQFYQLGMSRDWVFEIAVSDPVVPWVLLELYADMEEGTS